jgi:hypothetical protein
MQGVAGERAPGTNGERAGIFPRPFSLLTHSEATISMDIYLLFRKKSPLTMKWGLKPASAGAAL